MGKIYEVCEVCGTKYEESEYDGMCSTTCANTEKSVIGGEIKECVHCKKKYLTAKKHICSL